MTVSGKGSVPRYNLPSKVYHPSAKASITPFLKLVNWVVGKHDKQVVPQMVPYLMVTYQGAESVEKSPTTPLKINMEHNHGGLEDHVPFQMGDL